MDDIVTLIHGLSDPEKETRAKSTRLIAVTGSAAIPHLLPLLDLSDWKIRYRAAEALGLIGSEEAVPSLISTCSDEKDHVRYMAAKSLGMIKSPLAVHVLISLLTDEHPYTRGIASDGLAAIQDIRGKEPLRIAIEDEIDPELKKRMISSLSLLNNTIDTES